ncbi:MAG: D-tyrosyl-tRNA(Tyr) deacylase, partial [Muribaculaceae bacterium]|nr:D-tyrosyl-tRNA(Tyr) deacylase [Muribaculaceae bacterium]
MRIVIQRVKNASVTIDNKLHSAIGQGLLILVGITQDDTEADVKWLAQKTVNLRIFDDENGVMNRSVMDVAGEVLAVSQFTLYAS